MRGMPMPSYFQNPRIRQFFSKGQPLTYDKNYVILGNEAVPNGIYYLSSGYVKVYSVSDEGDQYIHIIYGPGELFPLIWGYIDIQPESLFYETLSETLVWRMSKEWFNAYIQADLELCYALSQQLAIQFRIYGDRVDNLEYKRASERVIYRLLFLASRFGVKDRDNHVISIQVPITHEVLANTINLARESVSRELERLEAEHLIGHNGHTIQILNVEGLAGRLSRPVSLENWHLI
jgi:CRP-like cAMP-binding protein